MESTKRERRKMREKSATATTGENKTRPSKGGDTRKEPPSRAQRDMAGVARRPSDIGMNLGAPYSRSRSTVSTGGALAAVPPAGRCRAGAARAGRGAYNTVTQWWSNSWATLGDEVYTATSRPRLPPAAAAARPTGPACTRARGNVHPKSSRSRRLAATLDAARSPTWSPGRRTGLSRRFVQRSRGRLKRRKPAYVKARAGWILDSDGRSAPPRERPSPSSRVDGRRCDLPPSAGLRFFAAVDEAV